MSLESSGDQVTESTLRAAPAQVSGSAQKWLTVSLALENWPRTLRLCLIIVATSIPIDIFVIFTRH
jgi:hypothetical protein